MTDDKDDCVVVVYDDDDDTIGDCLSKITREDLVFRYEMHM
jgi:hypothetical protein